VLVEAFRDVVANAADRFGGPLLIGGKSMGGRMATMLAAEPGLNDAVIGVVSMGYPLHPPGKPDQMRVAHLSGMRVPWLVIQGTRDPFGSPSDIAAACNAVDVRPALMTIEGGGHGFEIPKRTGSQPDVFAAVADGVVGWLDTLLSASGQ
jgi:predicted alpha/beta-hydrolase family hydrolase